MFGLGIVQWAAIGLLAILLSNAAGYFYGRETGYKVAAGEFNSAQITAIANAAATARKQQLEADKVSYNIALTYGGEQLRITGLTVIQIQKVPAYVTERANSMCVITDGFVRLHDAAAAGRDPDGYVSGATGVTADTPTEIKASEVAATVAANYGVYQEVSAELVALQDWVNQQLALHQ